MGSCGTQRTAISEILSFAKVSLSRSAISARQRFFRMFLPASVSVPFFLSSSLDELEPLEQPVKTEPINIIVKRTESTLTFFIKYHLKVRGLRFFYGLILLG